MREIKIHTGYTVKDTGCCIENTIEEVLQKRRVEELTDLHPILQLIVVQIYYFSSGRLEE